MFERKSVTSSLAESVRPVTRTIRRYLFPIPALGGLYLAYAVRRFGAQRTGSGVCLDIGAGTAPYRSLIEGNFSPSLYVSMDIARSDATTVVADATKMPVPSGSIALVVAMEVLQHIPDIAKVFAEIARVLAPGGLTVISFPFAFGECDVADFHRWSIAGMRYSLEACDLEVLDVRRRGGAFFVLTSALHLGVQHLLPGTRRSWRLEITIPRLLRAGITFLLAIPTAILGWIALGFDALLPKTGLYTGGLIVARQRTRET